MRCLVTAEGDFVTSIVYGQHPFLRWQLEWQAPQVRKPDRFVLLAIVTDKKLTGNLASLYRGRTDVYEYLYGAIRYVAVIANSFSIGAHLAPHLFTQDIQTVKSRQEQIYDNRDH